MGVLIEGVNVVIRNAAVAARVAGGSRSLSDSVPTERFARMARFAESVS